MKNLIFALACLFTANLVNAVDSTKYEIVFSDGTNTIICAAEAENCNLEFYCSPERNTFTNRTIYACTEKYVATLFKSTSSGKTPVDTFIVRLESDQSGYLPETSASLVTVSQRRDFRNYIYFSILNGEDPERTVKNVGVYVNVSVID